MRRPIAHRPEARRRWSSVKAKPRARNAIVSVPQMPELPSLLPPPSVDTEFMLDAPLQLAAGTDVLDVQQSIGTPQRGNSDGSMVSSVVDGSLDTSAVQLPENPKPVYPDDMLRQSIEAQFVVYFVIDSTGVVDTSTIEVPPSVRKSFAVAVKSGARAVALLPGDQAGTARAPVRGTGIPVPHRAAETMGWHVAGLRANRVRRGAE